MSDLVELAQRLVRAPGHNPPGEEAATVAVLADECHRRGWEVTLDDVAPGRPNLVAHLPGRPGPGLLFLGHSDVVPPGDGWTVDPYGGAVEDGYLYGRGSADMLGAVAALVHAMDALRDVAMSGPVTLAVLVDEEELGLGARAYVEQLNVEDYRACLVAEPTDLQPIVAARGDAYVEIAITGLAAHSGNPDDGRNAIQAMAAVVAEIERWHHDLATRPHPLVGPATWSIGTIEGGQATSTVPAHCRISADRRLLPGESAEDVLKAVDQAVDGLGLSERGFGFEVAMTMDMPGFETPIDAPFVDQVEDARRAAGLPPSTPGGWTAACDGGFIAERTGMPVVVLGPGSVTEAAHRPDERVRIADLDAAARTYAALATKTEDS